MIYKKTTLEQLRQHTIESKNYVVSMTENQIIISGETVFVYGLGERFNQVNQKGLIVENKVVEQFCNQGDKTYFPLPFFMLEKGFGLFINTKRVFNYDFGNPIVIDINNLESDTELYIFTGEYKEIIKDFITLTGEPLTPPKWTLGPWMSGHLWNSQSLIEEQVSKLKELEIPITSLVIEQWSDEATFYNFNRSDYKASQDFKTYQDYDFTNNTLWPNPKKMIETLHNEGIKVLLWQAPVVKALEPKDGDNLQHEIDQEYVSKNKLVVSLNSKDYTIPQNNWFNYSMIPDFTNPKMVDWWFKKRQYLSEIGVDGFKTDGGEFVHDLNTQFFSGETGLEMVNDYSRSYIDAYKQNISKEQVLFSRAGYIGQQSLTIQWSGDQKSTWSELKSVYNAGLSLSLSGQHLWSFDIAGFAGDLPSVELYIRATQLAVFSPIMQFHSEPVGGQFALLDPSEIINNERSPWNIAKYYSDDNLVPYIRKLYWLRMNLIPYIQSELLKAIQNKTTLMKHMMIDYPDDQNALLIDSQHMFGEIVVVPNLRKNLNKVDFYLPKGKWINIFTKEVYQGNKRYKEDANLYDISAFISEGTAIVSKSKNYFDFSDNSMKTSEIYFHLYGNKGSYKYASDFDNFEINWNNGIYNIESNNVTKTNIIIIFE